MLCGLGAGTCNLVTAASGSTSLSKGADLIVNDGWTYYLTVSALDGTRAVVCYTDVFQSYRGACGLVGECGSSWARPRLASRS